MDPWQEETLVWERCNLPTHRSLATVMAEFKDFKFCPLCSKKLPALFGQGELEIFLGQG
jgi:hypothetical protein